MKYRKLKSPNKETFLLNNQKKVYFKYEQDIKNRNLFYRVHKVSVISLCDNKKEDSGKNKDFEVGYLKIHYIDKNAFEKRYTNDVVGNLKFASDYSLLNLKIEEGDNVDFSQDDLKEISSGLYMSKNYDLVCDMENEIDNLTTQKELNAYVLNFKDDLYALTYQMKDRLEKTIVGKPEIEYIRTTDKIDGYRGQGLGLELYKKASQWMGANKMNLYAGQLNDKSSWIWDNKLSKINEFNFKREKVMYIVDNKNVTIEKMSIKRTDGKVKKENICKVR